jgi:hypothetical protein
VPALMTAAAVVMCIHGGQVIIQPSQTIVTISGMPVLTVPDLIGAVIVGCPQVGPGIVPCTAVVLTDPAMSASPTTMIAGKPAYVAMAVGAPGGLTNGVPPGMVICVNPGQLVAMG